MSEKMRTGNGVQQASGTTVDIDYAECAVPKWSRRSFVTMFMIMLGFTFFSASMWVGQEMAAGLDFWGFIKALLLGVRSLVFIQVCLVMWEQRQD